ncbi:MAG: hypothetical protein NTV61_03610 [Candidatus Bathyarchaeota archaeon]|nr:hypothetical protein [Candidatus Bathyarchaeota archaeon]
MTLIEKNVANPIKATIACRLPRRQAEEHGRKVPRQPVEKHHSQQPQSVRETAHTICSTNPDWEP